MTSLTTSGAITSTDTTAATSTTTGSLIVSGGAGIAGNAYVGGNANITGTVAITGNVTTKIKANAAIDSTSSTTGTIVVTGGVGVSGNIYVGGNANIIGIANVTGNINATSNINATGNIIVTGNANLFVPGGIVGQYLQTDGTGVLSWADPDHIAKGTSNVRIASSGGAAIVATAGTDRVTIDITGNVGINKTPITNNGVLQVGGVSSVQTILEAATVTGAAPSATQAIDLTTSAVQYFTASATNNFVLNITGPATIMQVGQSATAAALITNGATPYYLTGVQVDGAAQTVKWQGGTAPTSGNASAVDIYSITVIKTGAGTYSVFATQTKFA